MIAVNVVGMVTTVLAQRGRTPGVRMCVAARALAVLVALLSGVQVGSAEPFGWRAPAGCPTETDIRTRIERRLGTSVDSGAIHGIEITISREAGGFVAEIDARALTVANDIRTLRSTRCDALADAIAVIIARLATEARREPTRGRTDGSDTLMADLVAADISDPEVAASAVRRRAIGVRAPLGSGPRWGGGGHVLGLSGVGALPRLNLGGELAGYVRRNDTFVELAIGRWVPQTVALDPGAPAGVEVSLDVVSLRAGWGPHELPLRAWLLGELGLIHGTGVAVDDARTASARWTALGGGFGVAWPMSPIARLVGTVELAIPLERTRFMLRDGADLYQPAVAAARCSLGIEVGWK
ncbi:MAG: hypothetical protein JWP01_2257 [Myxococcales bacterium]|nr:hypothetical protein [Myxococcales bacterium]